MTHVVLIPGAGGAGWYWSRVVPILEAAGHTTVALDLPADDESAGLPEYVELAVSACADHSDLLLVGQSLGGFTAVMAADQLCRNGRAPRGLVLLNAMVPVFGETPGEWWGAVDSEPERLAAAEAGGWSTDPYDLEDYFLHDVDPAVAAEGEQHQHNEAEAVFTSVCDIEAWPPVPTRILAGANDRFFPLSLQLRVARARVGIEPEIVPGGHLAALSQPEAVAAAILLSA
ncbi:MAG: alpha/beta fold hydrolase [Marmoricola sp.]